MKKFIIFALLLILAFSTLGISAFAAEDVISGDAENVFEVIYREAINNADKILSALAFVGSLIIAFAYKKGFLPIVKGTLATLTATTAKLKEEAKTASEAANESVSDAVKKLDEAEKILTCLTEKIESLQSELKITKEEQKKSGDIGIIMRSQVDLLYEIFMSSSLPTYQKESVGEKISQMKKLLAASCESSEEESYE